MKINKLNKQTIKYGFFNGVFFAVGMALFEYYGNDGFNIWTFFFRLFFFGFFMGLFFRLSLKNKLNSEKDKTEMDNKSEN